MPISRILAGLVLSAATAAGDDVCYECKAAACYHFFDDDVDEAWRDSEAATMAAWDEISAREDDLAAANAEHDAVVVELEAAREARIAAAYDKLRACLEP